MDSTFTSAIDAPPIVLASSSPIRQQLLSQLGLTFTTVSPAVDERTIQQNPQLSPREVAEQLALLKAETVLRLRNAPHEIIIGSDQVACFQGRVLTKPGSPQANIEQLLQMSGQTHELCTAAVVLHQGQTFPLFVHSRLTFRSFSAAEITRYVTRDEPWECAGGYRWEAQGIALFETIETADHTAILGLPLLPLTNTLRHLGIPLP